MKFAVCQAMVSLEAPRRWQLATNRQRTQRRHEEQVPPPMALSLQELEGAQRSVAEEAADLGGRLRDAQAAREEAEAALEVRFGCLLFSER